MCQGSSVEFIAEQVQEHLDTDPTYWNEDQGCIMFGDVPVFYERFDDVFVLDIEGIQLEVPRI